MWVETWNLRTLYRAGAMNELIKRMDKYKIDICSLQKIRLPGKVTVITNNYLILYSGHKSDKYEFGTGFYISKHIMDEN
jgi:hypothetical protein